MMGRLIDAGLVLDKLSGRLESMKDYDAVKDVINNMQTAYDVDKVVAQLEEFREEMEQFKCGGMVSEMIEVVKAGGVYG